MTNEELVSEARRLLDMHREDQARLAEAGLSQDWRARIERAINVSDEEKPAAILPLLEDFVVAASRAYSPDEAVRKGVNLPPDILSNVSGARDAAGAGARPAEGLVSRGQHGH